tara:strand:- start:15004 stop:15441 length:438 start_codon:yes stop_codon:yes gene_type:complete
MAYSRGKYEVKNPDKYVGLRKPTYRSSWEAAFMRFCDNHPSISKWASESIKIPYVNPFTGRNTIYVPDFFIVYTDKKGKPRAELIEIKPSNQTGFTAEGKSIHTQKASALNQAKWEAAYKWSKGKGIKFRVVTEHEIFSNTTKRK